MDTLNYLSLPSQVIEGPPELALPSKDDLHAYPIVEPITIGLYPHQSRNEEGATVKPSSPPPPFPRRSDRSKRGAEAAEFGARRYGTVN